MQCELEVNMYYVGIATAKGGVGKTTLAHSLCYGASLLQYPAHCAYTDDPVGKLNIVNRPYRYYDCTDIKRLAALAEKAEGKEGIVVIDGQANRPDFDTWIAKSVDIILVPVMRDQASVKFGIDMLKRHKNAYSVLSEFPGNKKEAEAYLKEIANYGYDEKRELFRMPKIAKLSTFISDDPNGVFVTPPSTISSSCRNFFLATREKLCALSFDPLE
jgi:cellulose biosynthesis protein BcsQ